MVILIKAPKVLVLNRLIEKRFAGLCGFKAKLREFLTTQLLSSISGMDASKIPSIIAKSKKMHGYILNGGELMIHPSATTYFTKKMQERISGELSGDLTKFGHTKRITASYR